MHPDLGSNKRRALVTGGAGFIGSHLSERLLALGHQGVIVDDLSSGRLKNLETFQHHPALSFHRVDIRTCDQLKPCFVGVDWVFHLAGLADIVPSIETPDLYFGTNVQGTFHVLECARAAKTKRFIYAASSSSYGIPEVYPTPETAVISPQYPYALTKYMGEELVLHWARTYRLPALSLRLFNVYGPRSRTTGAYGAVFGVVLFPLAFLFFMVPLPAILFYAVTFPLQSLAAQQAARRAAPVGVPPVSSTMSECLARTLSSAAQMRAWSLKSGPPVKAILVPAGRTASVSARRLAARKSRLSIIAAVSVR